MNSISRFSKYLLSVLGVYAIAGLLIYSRVILKAGFVFDDFEYIVGNSLIQDLSVLTNSLSDSRQLGYFSFALNYLISGDNPFGFHLVNVIIHILNSVLVFILTRALLSLCGLSEADEGGEEALFWVPAAAGLLFIVHPLQTQAVSYVTQRFTSLATFFYLLAVVSYTAARKRTPGGVFGRKSMFLYGIALINTFAAMKVKEISFTLPVIIAIIEYIFFSASGRRLKSFCLIVPFIAAMAVIPLSILGPDWGVMNSGVGIAEITRKEKIFDLTERPVHEYFFTQLRIMLSYIRLLLFPYPQSVIYDIKPSRSLLDTKVMAASIFHAIVLASALFYWVRKRNIQSVPAVFIRLSIVGVCWFYLSSAVESSFLPIKDLMFEHRTYLPGIGIILAVIAAAMLITLRVAALKRSVRIIVAGIFIIAVVLGMVSFDRNNIWLSELNLWNDVVVKVPDKAIGYHNRGNALARLGKLELALDDINKAVSIFEGHIGSPGKWETSDYTPTNMAKTFMNRATIYTELGQSERAAADNETAKKMISMPLIDLPDARKRADVFYRRGAYSHAIEEYSYILGWFPDDLNALNDRGNAYSMSGKFRQAIADFELVLRRKPDWAMVYYNKGIAWLRSGDTKTALEDFTKACSLGFQPACEGITTVREGK